VAGVDGTCNTCGRSINCPAQCRTNPADHGYCGCFPAATKKNFDWSYIDRATRVKICESLRLGAWDYEVRAALSPELCNLRVAETGLPTGLVEVSPICQELFPESNIPRSLDNRDHWGYMLHHLSLLYASERENATRA